MPDLFDKLNVLVKSNLRQMLTLERHRESESDRASHAAPDFGRDIAALRKRIKQALDDEDQLQRDIQALHDEASEWDGKADAALSNGDEANARYAVQQMQLKQQQAALLEADLEQHRFSAAELIRQVNKLEAVAAEAVAATAEAAASTQAQKETAASDSGTTAANTPGGTSDDDLDQRRARLSQ